MLNSFPSFFYNSYKRNNRDIDRSIMENPYSKQYFNTTHFDSFFKFFLQFFIGFDSSSLRVKRLRKEIKCQ